MIAPLLVSPKDAAESLGLSERAFQRLLRTGELPVVRIGASVRVSVADLESWVTHHREDWATGEIWAS